VIGADQTLSLGNQLFDKARDLGQAGSQLRQLRGRCHTLHAGLAVAMEGRIVWRHLETATLTMRDFSDAFLARYLADVGEALLTSVGCYQLEGPGAQLFDDIDGDYFTILGLPLLPLLAFLRQQKVLAS